MKKLTVVQLLRIAGMLAWLMYPIWFIVMLTAHPDPMGVSSSEDWEGVVALLSLLVFGVCFWGNMRDIPVSAPSRQHFILLALQLVSAMGVSMFVGDSGLMYVLAAEIPLVMKREQSIKWISVQALLTLPWTWLIYETGHFVQVSELQALPPALLIGVTALVVISWQLFAFTIGWLAADEARHRRELARLNMELFAAHHSLAEKSRVEERLSISRELHDVMGHHLVALNLQLELASRTNRNENNSHILTASKVARDLLAEARKIVGVLRQEPQEDLAQLLHSLQSSIPYPAIHLDIQAGWEAPNEVQHAFLRCIQEAVSNTLRHSNASAVWIELRSSDGSLHLSVWDNGDSYAAAPEGTGLTGMRERVERLAGTMRISGCQPQGFRIDINVPGRKGK
jgi:signal transduction histidine kinase